MWVAYVLDITENPKDKKIHKTMIAKNHPNGSVSISVAELFSKGMIKTKEGVILTSIELTDDFVWINPTQKRFKCKQNWFQKLLGIDGKPNINGEPVEPIDFYTRQLDHRKNADLFNSIQLYTFLISVAMISSMLTGFVMQLKFWNDTKPTIEPAKNNQNLTNLPNDQLTLLQLLKFSYYSDINTMFEQMALRGDFRGEKFRKEIRLLYPFIWRKYEDSQIKVIGTGGVLYDKIEIHSGHRAMEDFDPDGFRRMFFGDMGFMITIAAHTLVLEDGTTIYHPEQIEIIASSGLCSTIYASLKNEFQGTKLYNYIEESNLPISVILGRIFDNLTVDSKGYLINKLGLIKIKPDYSNFRNVLRANINANCTDEYFEFFTEAFVRAMIYDSGDIVKPYDELRNIKPLPLSI
jgi:hypothetical protein